MFITVTLNPSLDRTLVVPGMRWGELNRARQVELDVGGKGFNVSRALAELGANSLVMGILGGSVGQYLQRRLIEAGFETDLVFIEGETRCNITLIEEATGQVTKINEPGPRVTAPEANAVLDKLCARVSPGDFCLLSGNLPPGTPEDIYARLIQAVQARGARAFLDSSGGPLARGYHAGPYLVKCNVEEAEALLGHPLTCEAELVHAVRALREPGAQIAVISRGAHGLLMGAPEGIIAARPPDVKATSPVAAGDALLASLAWALHRGFDVADVARWGVAMGTATAMELGSRVAGREQAEKLVGQIRVEKLI